MYWITGVLGLALAAASGLALISGEYVMGLDEHTDALWVTALLGLAIAGFSGVKAVLHDQAERWEYWAIGLAALAAIATPFVLGFSDHQTALWTGIVLSAAVAALAAYEAFLAKPQMTEMRPEMR